ncbi:2,3-bisphosphoglycerate-independent phosphoglycerate mutase [Candidatus Peregrinibacteria bacterium]|nr:MAG: 2,3-bisphosphoglycerate-independent phosphoglycerate mutase [Candidatus Peregrinibacteria bacterium]
MSQNVCLVIFDGFGEALAGPGNAVKNAHTPHLDQLRQNYPFSLLQASGEAVGVIEGVMGSSEIGHFTMGAGRVVPQFLLAINKDIESGEFFKKQPLINALAQAKASGKKLHILGMISDKGVHCHIDHMLALLKWAAKEGLEKVYIHAITDGRDVPPQTAQKYLAQLQEAINNLGVGSIATVIGRYYTMDRDNNWDRIKVGYDLMVNGLGEKISDPVQIPHHFYTTHPGKTDQYITPYVVDENGLIEDGDTVIFANFRTDRPRQITAAFTDPAFDHFEQPLKHVHWVCMGPYSDQAPVVYHTPVVKNNLADWLAAHHITQLRVTETEKYAHLTYFFNSQEEHAKPLEDRIHIHTPQVKTHDEKPELAAAEITQAVVDAMHKGAHRVIMVNYANADLVGHTGNYEATVKAMEALDECLGKLVAAAKETNTVLLLTGDHGNAEEMLLEDGTPRTSHTTNPVIFVVMDPAHHIQSVKNGGLKDVAPTVLQLLSLAKPAEMTGISLVA